MTTALATVSPTDLEASICQDSFYQFVRRFWDTAVAGAPVWNWHIPYLCDELQTMAERVFQGLPKEYDLLVNISPGTTKSTIFSVMFPAWVWTRMPECRTICGSYSHELSMDLSTRCRDVIQSEKYQTLFPDIELRDDQNTKRHFKNAQGGYRYATSTGGTVTGMHGHFLIVDDPLSPEQAASEADLKVCNHWMSETLPTRKVDKTVTPLMLIMQRLHIDDPAGQMIEKSRSGMPIRHICLPAEIGPSEKDSVRPRALARRYIGGLMDPVRLSRGVLDAQVVEGGMYAYSGQFLQRPLPLGGGMFRIEHVRIEVIGSRKFLKLVRYWDKAGTGGRGCFTVGVLMAIDNERRYWVLDVVRGQWEACEREKVIKNTAIADGRDIIIGVEQEPGSGGKESAQNTVRNLAGFRVRLDRPVGDKMLRADPYAVQVNSGNLYLAPGPWNRAYLNELQHFGPECTYKDQVDASSGAFAMIANVKRKVGGMW